MILKKLSRKIYLPLIVAICTLIYNEYLIYYQVISECKFPTLNSTSSKPVNVMLIADTHLLGSRNGHWFDKLRREWQQYRAYQTANYYLKPNYILILGDLTDEGKWCGDNEWNYYVNRTNELFTVDNKITKLFILVGNHDVGFHYNLNDHMLQRFNRSFSKQFIDFYQLEENNVSFVLLNSMALENDRCKFCNEAQRQLKDLNSTLNCIRDNNCKHKGKTYEINKNKKYTKPIIFTHFPLYRTSDKICPNDIDSEPIEQSYNYKPNFDCLSKDSTKQVLYYFIILTHKLLFLFKIFSFPKLIELLNPRVVFSGHTHFSCFNQEHGVPEHTIASFSWRNIKTPSMLLVKIIILSYKNFISINSCNFR